MSTSDKKARVARSKKAKVAADCYDVLTNVFEKTHYKGQQQEIVEAALEGEDILVVAPTGMGKSLCFQIPAIAAKNGITFVISPLLALMKNQVSRLRDHGVRAAALNSESSSEERSEITSDLASSNPQTRLLYITPEKMGTPSFQLSLSKLYNRGKITRFVLDEAHCISEWGHSFRIDYRNLGFLKKKYPLVPIMALTASATAIVREDIITNLNMSPSLLTFIHPFNRENLFYEVQYFKNPQPQSQYATVASYINNLTRRKGGEASTGIVYARRRETCDQLAEFLRRSGIAARAYHRGLSNAELDQTLTEWENEDQCKVVCATVAFGMGIDKANCRFVIHYDLPGSFEGFYQETGRAGRDGSASKCILYYSREDAIRVQKLVSRNHAAREQNDGPEPSQRAPESIQALINFAENTSVCRHVLICRYFGEVVDTSDEDVRKSYCNQMCDICKYPDKIRIRKLKLSSEEDAVAAVRSGYVPTHARPLGESHDSENDTKLPNNRMAISKIATAGGLASRLHTESRKREGEPLEKRTENIPPKSGSSSKKPNSGLAKTLTPAPAVSIAKACKQKPFRVPFKTPFKAQEPSPAETGSSASSAPALEPATPPSMPSESPPVVAQTPTPLEPVKMEPDLSQTDMMVDNEELEASFMTKVPIPVRGGAYSSFRKTLHKALFAGNESIGLWEALGMGSLATEHRSVAIAKCARSIEFDAFLHSATPEGYSSRVAWYVDAIQKVNLSAIKAISVTEEDGCNPWLIKVIKFLQRESPARSRSSSIDM